MNIVQRTQKPSDIFQIETKKGSTLGTAQERVNKTQILSSSLSSSSSDQPSHSSLRDRATGNGVSTTDQSHPLSDISLEGIRTCLSALSKKIITSNNVKRKCFLNQKGLRERNSEIKKEIAGLDAQIKEIEEKIEAENKSIKEKEDATEALREKAIEKLKSKKTGEAQKIVSDITDNENEIARLAEIQKRDVLPNQIKELQIKRKGLLEEQEKNSAVLKESVKKLVNCVKKAKETFADIGIFKNLRKNKVSSSSLNGILVTDSSESSASKKHKSSNDSSSITSSTSTTTSSTVSSLFSSLTSSSSSTSSFPSSMLISSLSSLSTSSITSSSSSSSLSSLPSSSPFAFLSNNLSLSETPALILKSCLKNSTAASSASSTSSSTVPSAHLTSLLDSLAELASTAKYQTESAPNSHSSSSSRSSRSSPPNSSASSSSPLGNQSIKKRKSAAESSSGSSSTESSTSSSATVSKKQKRKVGEQESSEESTKQLDPPHKMDEVFVKPNAKDMLKSFANLYKKISGTSLYLTDIEEYFKANGQNENSYILKWSILHYLVEFKRVKTLEAYLEEYKPSINTEHGWNALHIICMDVNPTKATRQIAKLLVKTYGPSIVTEKNPQGTNAFNLAIYYQNASVAEELLPYIKDLTTLDDNGFSPIHYACMQENGSPLILRMLMHQPTFNIEVKAFLKAPIVIAAELLNVEIVEELLEYNRTKMKGGSDESGRIAYNSVWSRIGELDKEHDDYKKGIKITDMLEDQGIVGEEL